MNDFDFPGGATVYREYEVLLNSGATGSITFTLGDMDRESPGALLARRAGALAFGLISLANVPGAPKYPFVWTHDAMQFGVTVEEDDADLSSELRNIIVRYICMFLDEFAPLVPEIDGFTFVHQPVNENTVH